MNKKQKILTILALAVFVAIGACHYLAIRSYPDYSGGKCREETKWRDPTAEWVPEEYQFASGKKKVGMLIEVASP